jgi:hypothetical protein
MAGNQNPFLAPPAASAAASSAGAGAANPFRTSPEEPDPAAAEMERARVGSELQGLNYSQKARAPLLLAHPPLTRLPAHTGSALACDPCLSQVIEQKERELVE